MWQVFANPESGEIRRAFGAWRVERSVFYLYGIDWIYLEDWEDWTLEVSHN